MTNAVIWPDGTTSAIGRVASPSILALMAITGTGGIAAKGRNKSAVVSALRLIIVGPHLGSAQFGGTQGGLANGRRTDRCCSRANVCHRRGVLAAL